MSIERMIVVLRTELGTQLSLAQKYHEKLEEATPEFPTKKQLKALVQSRGRINRLQTAAHALGALMLRDIMDEEE